MQLFNEEFIIPGELSLSDFSEITFKTSKNVSEYSYSER